MKPPAIRAAAPSLARARRLPDAWLMIALLVALALRLLLWGGLPRAGLISDEGEYLSAASWLAAGRGFAWYQGYLWTRAPLYPLFVAAHLRIFGDTLAPIYATQTALSLVNVALVYLLARRLVRRERPEANQVIGPGASDAWETGDGPAQAPSPWRQRSIPAIAALLMALYFPLALYTQALLSETLFIALLLGGFLALAAWADQAPSPSSTPQAPSPKPQAPNALVAWLVLAGVLFGLATLTRSLTLLFLPVAALWIFLQPATGGRRLASSGDAKPPPIVHRLSSVLLRQLWRPGVFLLAAALTIAPWTIYASRLYGGLVVVDTSGAFNLLYGARTAYDGDRNDAATRNFVLALLDRSLSQPQRRALVDAQLAKDGTVARDPSCLLRKQDPRLLAALDRRVEQISQAERQQLMTAEGLCLLAARPGAFVAKSLGELVDLFQINYTGAERFTGGFASGRLPRWFVAGLFLLDDTLYVLVLPLAVIGWGLTRQRASVPTLAGLWWLYNVAVAPLLFAINRFRLPLLPLAFVFAGCALAQPPRAWRALRSRGGLAYGALAALLALVAVAPYAYFEPRAPGADSTWASYLGPYPSSVVDTLIAWRARPGYLREQQVMRALGRGDAPEARALLASSEVTSHTLGLAAPLLAGLEGHPDQGLALLGATNALSPVEAAVVRGDLLRRKGDWPGARQVLGQTLVDNANPVQFAWDWLHPVPLPENRLDLAGNLDLGYVEGCYLGEGDGSLRPPANFRWCGDGARLRFPGAGTGAPQTLALRVDGRGWASYAPAAPAARVVVDGQEVGSFTPDVAGPSEVAVLLPPAPRGADVVVTLRSDTFVPPADRYLSQQGKAVVGQVQRLGVRIDWAELREH